MTVQSANLPTRPGVHCLLKNKISVLVEKLSPTAIRERNLNMLKKQRVGSRFSLNQ